MSKRYNLDSMLDRLATLYRYENQPDWVAYGVPVLFGVLFLSAVFGIGWISRTEYLVYTPLAALIQLYAVRWARRRGQDE